jgi:hypothetical protein
LGSSFSRAGVHFGFRTLDKAVTLVAFLVDTTPCLYVDVLHNISGALTLFSKYNGIENLQNGGFCHFSTRWSKNLSLLPSKYP